MEPVLRPDRLDLDPQDPDAALAFEHWLACFQSYLAELRATEPAVMHRILLSRVTPKVYSFIRDLPTYEGALDALKRQYLRPVNTVYARHRLATRQQRPGESCAEFLRALQTLVRACDCKTLTAEQHAELLVRDAFVTGLRSVYMRQRLLENSDLTLSSAIEKANALEAARHNADAVQSRDSPPVPWTPQTPPPPAPGSEFANAAASRHSTSSPTQTTAVARKKLGPCYFCGQKKHPRQRCPAREATCSSCGKRGHFAKVCKSQPRAECSAAGETWGPPSCMPGCGRPSLSTSARPAPDPRMLTGYPRCERPSLSTSARPAPDPRMLTGYPRCERPSLSASACPAPDPPMLTGYPDGDPTLATVTLDQSAPHQLARSMMDIQVEGHWTGCLFDTGSTGSFIHPDTVQRCGLATRPVSRRFHLASGSQSADIRAGCVATLVVQGTVYRDFELLVMPNLCAPVLLGLDFQSHLESVTMVYDGPLPPLTVKNPQFCGTSSHTPLLTTHTHGHTHPIQNQANSCATDTCSLSTLKIPPPPLFANLTPDCKPVATKSRRYSAGDRAFIRSEVQRLLREGIIEPSTSPWRAQVVVVRTGQKNRMVVDYSQTINRFTQLDAYPLPRIADMVNQIAQYKVYSTIDLKSAYHQLPICPEDRPYTAFEAGGRLYHFLRVPFGVTNGVSVFQREMDRMVDQYQLQATFPYLDNITICGHDRPDHDANLRQFLQVAAALNLTYNRDKCVFGTTRLAILGLSLGPPYQFG
ncbi:uncharacterized protein LOC132403623 [Hypanus sabinus]|uniref:uncharacterized protein LOC132403623 n=1 Tax=Hypanus sabinus TaxID=79690 RepID=UPI0028C424E9|nr:uncharacterized protein LOC132403623 [Hypanus sabinus]